MAVTYFGYKIEDSPSPGTYAAPGAVPRYWWNMIKSEGVYNFRYTGLGDQPLYSIELWAKGTSALNGRLRLALYNAARTTLICEGSAYITVNSATAQWWKHTAFKDKDGNDISPPTLSADTDYTICWSVNSTDIQYCYDSSANGDASEYDGIDYTSTNYPASLGGGSATNRMVFARVGVGTADSGATIPPPASIPRGMNLGMNRGIMKGFGR